MGLFDFLKKKKDEDDDLDLDSPEFGETPDLADPLGGSPPDVGGMPGVGQRPMQQMPGVPGQAPLFGTEPEQPSQMDVPPPMTRPGFGQQQMAPPGPPPEFESMQHSLNLLASRLDAIKVSIDRLTDKIEYLERYLMGGQRRY
ncbi:MAG TPA: hypothetical protein ENN30_00935 [Candidatus Woesearchaeota archaeon]|nr:hypothetical protein [Candidatus Woesearchaeota archaeon]